jgi:hypothetical protein
MTRAGYPLPTNDVRKPTERSQVRSPLTKVRSGRYRVLRDTKRCSQVSRFCCQSGSDNKIETGAIKFESTVGKIEIGDRKFDAIVLKE